MSPSPGPSATTSIGPARRCTAFGVSTTLGVDDGLPLAASLVFGYLNALTDGHEFVIVRSSEVRSRR